MALALLAGLLLAADSPGGTVVLVARRTAVSASEAQAIAAQCATALGATGVPIALAPDAALKQLARVSVRDTASCAGRRACVAALGRQLHVAYVVAVSVARLNRETSVGLELVRVADEAVVEKDGFILGRKQRPNAELLAGFAGRLEAVLVPAPPPPAPPIEPPPDAPKQVALTPPPAAAPVVPVVAQAPRTHTRSWVLLAGGAVALGAAAALLAVGLSSRAALEQGTPGPDGRVRATLTGSEAQAVNSRSSVMVGTAVGAAVVAAGLAGAAVVTW